MKLWSLSVMKLLTILTIMSLLFLYGCEVYKSYDECLLGEMKGQQAAMQSTAEKVCERKFPYEKKIYSFRDGEFHIAWSKKLHDLIEVEVQSNKTEYRITKAVLNFSKKPCDQSNENDFNNSLSFSFIANTAVARSPVSGDFQCMRSDSVYGIIR